LPTWPRSGGHSGDYGQDVTTETTVELLSVSTVDEPVTHTWPASDESADGPASCSSKYRCACPFTRADRPVPAAPIVELRTRVTEPFCTRTLSVVCPEMLVYCR
jgi:hypothetical protein